MNGGQTAPGLDLEPNSKPYLLKRLISDGFDVFLIFVIFTAAAWALFSSPAAAAYNSHREAYLKIAEETRAEFGSDEAAAADALRGNALYRDEFFAADLHSYLLKAAAALPAEIIVLLVFPLAFKDRATPGKLMTGLMPFCERKQTRATRGQVFGRFLFIFVIDSLFLYLFTGRYTFLLVPVLRLCEMLLNRKNRTLADALSGVTVIEKKSYNGID